MTVLDELLPIMVDMSTKKITGTINLTNPGLISHNEILEMYKEIVDSKFTYKNFSIEEQAKILAADRSNNYLDTSRLEKLYPNQFLDIYMKFFTISGLCVFYSMGVEFREYYFILFIFIVSLILHFASRKKIRSYFN